jgi:hypothetical protein
MVVPIRKKHTHRTAVLVTQTSLESTLFRIKETRSINRELILLEGVNCRLVQVDAMVVLH